jgi:hypothetical protein
MDTPEASWQFSPMTTDPARLALAEALRERLAVIGDRALRERDPSAHLERLKSASERIVALQSALPGPTDPRLAHYLERCSYEKALAILEGRE